MSNQSNRYNLVVVGSGFAGSMTGLSFLERCKKDHRSGGLPLSRLDGKENAAVLLDGLWLAYFDEDWVKEMELVSKALADLEYYYARLGLLVPELLNVFWVIEFAIIASLFGHTTKYDNCDIFWETEGVKLLTTEGAMDGVRVRKPDGLLANLYGSNVMLACGGFEGNQEILTKYIDNRTVGLALITLGLKYNRGAGTAGSFDGMHCELVDTRANKPDAVIWGHNYGIAVDKNCDWFYDEGKRHLFATFELIAMETWCDHNSEVYFVTDSTITNRFRPGWVYDTSDVSLFEAGSIRELAEKLNIDPSKLEKTVKKFNAACNDKEFDLMALDGKATSGLSPNKVNWSNPIDTPPFYGVPTTSHLTFTYSGLKVNPNPQVLSTNHVPIPCLYAAGELVGLFHHEYPPATSRLRSMAFGKEARTLIAKVIKRRYAGK